jgi:DUF971 family protein
MATPKPTDIKLHQASRMLELKFDDGYECELSCEYLRCFSPSAEVRGHAPGEGTLQYGKKDINITGIRPVGNYAVVLEFDDNHDSGIFSWEYLHDLGKKQASNWKQYLKDLEKEGKRRAP